MIRGTTLWKFGERLEILWNEFSLSVLLFYLCFQGVPCPVITLGCFKVLFEFVVVDLCYVRNPVEFFL